MIIRILFAPCQEKFLHQNKKSFRVKPGVVFSLAIHSPIEDWLIKNKNREKEVVRNQSGLEENLRPDSKS